MNTETETKKEIKTGIEPIKNSNENTRFYDHLNIPFNDKTILSGIFGIGKTHFIKEFFKENKDKYVALKLSPVNYSISKNDDVIEYIKNDLAFNLLSEKIDFEKTDFSLLLSSEHYLKDNFLDTASILAKNAGKIGKTISGIYESIKEINDNIKKHNEKVTINEKKELIDFLEEFTEKIGSIYEENRITQLISILIEKLKNKETEDEKEVVLVIDDLDRLDPEHIFRILNVFACHFDLEGENGNKFGVDKIILVCDVENIRNIFHTKYGTNVDFTGYIDKFYSREIFYLNNTKITYETVNYVLNSLETIGISDSVLNLKDEHMSGTYLLRELLFEFINSDLLSMRNLLKLYGKKYSFEYFNFYYSSKLETMSNRLFPLLSIFELLTLFFGSINNVKIALDKLIQKKPLKRISFTHLYILSPIIPFLEYKQKGFSDKKNVDFSDTDLNLTINYTQKISQDFNSRGIRNTEINKINYKDHEINSEGGNDTSSINLPFTQLVKNAFEKYIALDKEI